MLTLIFSENSFWLINHFIFTILTGGGLFFLSIIKAKFDILSPNIAEKYKECRLFLPIIAIHIFLQFFYNFIYNFSFVDFIGRFVFYFLILHINIYFLSGAKNISSDLKTKLEKGRDFFTVFTLFICFLSILNGQSSNSCGQSLLPIFTLVDILLGALTCFNAFNSFKLTGKEIDMLIESIEKGEMEGEEYTEKSLMNLTENRLLHVHFGLSGFLSCFVYSVLFYIKIKGVDSGKDTCSNLFAEKSVFFKFLFSFLEVLCLNALNLFVFYDYYFKNRKEFEPQISFENRMTEEVFENSRSAMIRLDKQEIYHS